MFILFLLRCYVSIFDSNSGHLKLCFICSIMSGEFSTQKQSSSARLMRQLNSIGRIEMHCLCNIDHFLIYLHILLQCIHIREIVIKTGIYYVVIVLKKIKYDCLNQSLKWYLIVIPVVTQLKTIKQIDTNFVCALLFFY